MIETTQKKGKSGGVVSAFIFLGLSVALTLVIVMYNSYLANANTKLATDIGDIDARIIQENKDPNLQIYNLITKNQPTLTLLEQRSQIPDFLSHLNSLKARYGIEFKSFNYNQGKILTESSTSETSSLSPYITVSDFIAEYRKDSSALFDLSFIPQFTGTNTLLMPITFEIKKSGVKEAQGESNEQVEGDSQSTQSGNNDSQNSASGSTGEQALDTNI